MTTKESKAKPKKLKKPRKDRDATSDTSHEVTSPAEAYVAGEVADSLFSKKSTPSVTPLFSLFDTKACPVQPLYVPVVATKPKRKLPEIEDKKQKRSAAAVSGSSDSKSKAAKKELTVAEKKVADRERSLTNADEEETLKKNLGKNLKNKNLTDDDDDLIALRIKKKQIKAEERVKNKRTVFVGNLPTSCTKQMLKSCFKEFGQIESMRFRSVARADSTLSRKVATIQRMVHPNRKNINAYVVFKEQDSAAKALVRNGTEISGGFHIRVDLASKNTSHDNKKSAFVGNLPYDVDEEAVREHFSPCGAVEAVRIIRDKATGIGKGFGYVLFQTADSVHLALKLDNSELMGRKLRVKRCLTNPAQSAQKNTGFKKKSDTKKQGKFQKNNTFMGETADAKTGKTKKPKKKRKGK